jgi:signal transduction histidine kinase/DNA-binding response OmpR family regulator
MNDATAFVQNADAAAFVILGLATVIGWLRGRERSLGYLALAIVLLSAVVVLGRVPSLLGFNPAAVSQVSLIGFMASGYALLRYRGSLIALRPGWHRAVVIAMVAACTGFLLAEALNLSTLVRGLTGLALIVIWLAVVLEPITRFWLVSRRLPAVQAWRLRSLTLGFGGLVAVLALAIAASAVARNPAVNVIAGLVVLAIVPLLYVSFSPPAWLRRQWRAPEEEGLRAFMEQLLVDDDRERLANRALEWAIRLVGGAAAIFFDGAGRPSGWIGVDADQVAELGAQLPTLVRGVNRISLGGVAVTLLELPVKGLIGTTDLVILAGPFSPGFGSEEMSRVQQVMSAFITALDRRHLMVQLAEANARLEEANRHKSAFLANMSHELRTPLNAIIGFSELLTDGDQSKFDEATRQRFLVQILASGRHLLSLINDILDLSKVEAGQMELRPQAVGVPELVDQVARTVEPLLAKKSIRLQVAVQAAGTVVADPGKLKQMLLNLVSNAIKFTPDGGTVTIAARRLETTLELSIEDNGIGIAPTDQASIFTEFHQVDHGPGRHHEGTGLGLALTRRFALLHHGDIRVSSEVGKGSTFTLSLPLQVAKERPVDSPDVVAKRNGHHAGPLVLVAEDDPASAELLTRHLTGAGFQSLVVRTGPDVIAKAKELKPAAITLDIMLPELDGWDVLTRLKIDPATSEIPIFVVSIVDNPELGLSLGAIDYFVKPVDAKDLISRLNGFYLKHAVGKGEIRILVVDDEPANREWLSHVLEPAGFKVELAAGGKEGVELAKSTKPDLVLLDLMMPVVSGFDVVEALRADDGTRETPIMILTSANLSESDKRQLNGRVSEILSRGSVGAAEITSLLRRVIADHTPVPA